VFMCAGLLVTASGDQEKVYQPAVCKHITACHVTGFIIPPTFLCVTHCCMSLHLSCSLNCARFEDTCISCVFYFLLNMYVFCVFYFSVKYVRWSGWVWDWVGECFFWYRPTRIVPHKRPLNCCVCVCLSILAWENNNRIRSGLSILLL